MKITKKVTTVEQVEIEVSLPYFTKTDNAYYCIMSEDRALKVLFAEYPTLPPLVAVSHVSVSYEAQNGEPITSKDFEYAFQTATDYLADTFESMRDTIRESKNEVYDNVTINGDESIDELKKAV